MIGTIEKAELEKGLSEFHAELTNFAEFGAKAIVEQRKFGEIIVPVYQNEF